MSRVLTPQDLLTQFESLPRSGRWWLAYSGGCDSHVLLHLMAGLREQLGFSLSAVYVNHGLSPHAAEWARHCHQQAAALGVECAVLAVDARPKDGESPEAAARRARYAALHGLLAERDILFTAHHQRDQAETLLLQLLRGAGPKGLSAMPRCAGLGRATVYRPLLDVPYEGLLAYAQQQSLDWIDDESNLDTRFDRNYLRHQVMPLLRDRWPAADRTLSRSAQHCAEASDILREVAVDDLQLIQGDEPRALSVAKLGLLREARQRNVLRHWLQSLGFSLPSDARLRQIIDEVMAAADDAEPCVRWAGVEVRRYRGYLYALRSTPATTLPEGWRQSWTLAGDLSLPDGRRVVATPDGSGLAMSAARLKRAGLVFCLRQGGEQIRPVGSAHQRSLKKLLQDHAVPPWQRKCLPLLYVDGELAAVMGVCVAEGFQPTSTADALHLVLQG